MSTIVRLVAVFTPMVWLLGCGQPAVLSTKPVTVASAKTPHDHSGWWCDEHGVPEGDCSMCDRKVARKFKAKGDWCDDHDRAKSQCFVCDPKLKEKYAIEYRAKFGKEPPEPEGQFEKTK